MMGSRYNQLNESEKAAFWASQSWFATLFGWLYTGHQALALWLLIIAVVGTIFHLCLSRRTQ